MSRHIHSHPLHGPACPLACILPPHVLESIALNADRIRPKGNETKEQRANRITQVRQRALQNLGVLNSLASARVGLDESMRATRQAARMRRVLGVGGYLGAALAGQPSRTIMTAKNKQVSSGPVVRKEGDGPTGDAAVDEAYDYMGATYDLFWQIYGRDSIDEAGMPLDGVVHYGKDYANAFWDGQRMIYGDGDGEQFERFTKAIDVIGHELTHGVVQHEAGLIYWAEAGALNESISDVFGSLVKQRYNNQRADQADWLIGQEPVHAECEGQGDTFARRAGDRVRRSRARQGSPAGSHARFSAHAAGQRRRTHQLRHTESRFYLAAMSVGGYAWETVGLSGIKHCCCAHRGCSPVSGRTPSLLNLPNSRCRWRNSSTRSARNRRQSVTRGRRSGSRYRVDVGFAVLLGDRRWQ